MGGYTQRKNIKDKKKGGTRKSIYTKGVGGSWRKEGGGIEERRVTHICPIASYNFLDMNLDNIIMKDVKFLVFLNNQWGIKISTDSDEGHNWMFFRCNFFVIQ